MTDVLVGPAGQKQENKIDVVQSGEKNDTDKHTCRTNRIDKGLARQMYDKHVRLTKHDRVNKRMNMVLYVGQVKRNNRTKGCTIKPTDRFQYKNVEISNLVKLFLLHDKQVNKNKSTIITVFFNNEHTLKWMQQNNRSVQQRLRQLSSTRSLMIWELFSLRSWQPTCRIVAVLATYLQNSCAVLATYLQNSCGPINQ